MADLDLTGAELDLTIYQGATFVLPINGYSDANGTLIDITTYTGSADARVTTNDATASFSFTVTMLPNSVSGSGSFTLSLTSAQSAAVSGGDYVYDVKLVNGPSVAYPLFGAVVVKPRVTR